MLFSSVFLLGMIDFYKLLLYFQLPHFFAAWGIVTINVVQHDGCEIIPEGEPCSGPQVTEFNAARNLTGRAINFWTMNNGYHTAHHLVGSRVSHFTLF